MAIKKKKRKGCHRVKGGGCMCKGKFAKKSRCGGKSRKVGKRVKARKGTKRGCYAKTRSACELKIKRSWKIATKRKRARNAAAKAKYDARPGGDYDTMMVKYGTDGLAGVRRRRRRRR